MPVYVYEILDADNQPIGRFECVQSMREPALEKHPESGERVRRVMLPPHLASKYTPGSTARKLENGNLEKAGFTKYEKDKLTGRYHRVAGSTGPDVIQRPNGPLS
jgi:hypothetical protein